MNKKAAAVLTAVLLIGGLFGFVFGHRTAQVNNLQVEKRDRYLAFTFEVYDQIRENYWQELTDDRLVNLYALAIGKLTGRPQNFPKNEPAVLEKTLTEIISGINDENQKKDFVTQLADVVLSNLEPFGRSRLYTQKDEKALADNVNNISHRDHYQTIGLNQDASSEEITQAFDNLTRELEPQAQESTEAAERLAQIKNAHEILKREEARAIYDETGVEPTFTSKLIRPDILHLHLTKFSPTTLEDLERYTREVDTVAGLDTLIFDLRDNIGGSIDGLPYFLGPFIGNDQYAYQFFHRGETTDYKTKIGWLPSLVRYKKVVVLINENTQSSAEVMAATLKKYNVGVLVGTKSKGWGTVEKVFPVDSQITEEEKYSLFLVHSLTLREDGQPIQDNGVEPEIVWTDPTWENQLLERFNYPELVEAVREIRDSAD